MEKAWEQSPDTVIISPLADVVTGWPEVRRSYDPLFGGPMRITTEFYDYSIHQSGDIFYEIGRERGQWTIGGKTLQLTPRAMNIFRRRKDGSWKLVHHHISLEGAPK